MINRLPEPVRVIFIANITPHFIEFRVLNLLNINNNIARIQAFQHRSVDRFEARFFFFNSLMTVFGLISSTRAVSRIPLPFNAISIIRFLTSGK